MKRSNVGPELDHFDIVLLNVVQENNLLTTEQLAEKSGTVGDGLPKAAQAPAR